MSTFTLTIMVLWFSLLCFFGKNKDLPSAIIILIHCIINISIIKLSPTFDAMTFIEAKFLWLKLDMIFAFFLIPFIIKDKICAYQASLLISAVVINYCIILRYESYHVVTEAVRIVYPYLIAIISIAQMAVTYDRFIGAYKNLRSALSRDYYVDTRRWWHQTRTKKKEREV
jgi:hypothetical protein